MHIFLIQNYSYIYMHFMHSRQDQLNALSDKPVIKYKVIFLLKLATDTQHS